MANKGLKAWTDKLCKQNMPVLGNVIAELNAITGSDESDATQLAEVILRDPNLTSHVLRVANSVRYNYTNQHINTVSRAIVLIGLKGVRAICISLLVLENLLDESPKERILQLVAQGFHAATQASNLLKSTDVGDREEVFIAGLLYNLGEMAFWSAEDITEETSALLSGSPKLRRKAMEDVLGTSFKALSKQLARYWSLGETLEQALSPSAQASEKVRAVVTGERLSRAALYGWDSPQVKKVIGEVAEFKGKKLEDVLDEVKACADKASEAAVNYGAAEVCPLIPSTFKTDVTQERKPASKIMKPDAMLQLNILRELSSAVNDQMDVNALFQMVLEGMHRGVGLERVALAFIQGNKMQAKYVIGEGTEQWRTNFNFDVGPFSENIFVHTIESGGDHWFSKSEVDKNPYWYPDDLVTALGRMPSFVYLLKIKGRNSAMFYADRWNYGGELSQDQFDSFKHFAVQAQMCLTAISEKSAQRA